MILVLSSQTRVRTLVFVSAVWFAADPELTNYTAQFRGRDKASDRCWLCGIDSLGYARCVGCLDYVFCSQHLRPVQALQLPTKDDILQHWGSPLPNQHWPSDHLMLLTRLRL